MIHDDPLIRLLQTADAVAGSAAPPADLSDRVRRRHSRQAASAKRLKIGLAGVAASILVIVAIYHGQPPVEPGANMVMGSSNDAARLADLRAQADAFGAEADALQRQLNQVQRAQSRQELRQEHQSQVLAQISNQSLPSPQDRVALIGLSQGDFYRDIRQSLDQAKAAYESVVTEYPNTHWAEVAQSRIELLNMN